MSIAALCAGAFLLGWFLPELVFMHSKRTGGVPLPFNLLIGAALALIAYGVKA